MLKDCGKGPGKSWNFKILKKGTNPGWESMYSQTSPCGHLFNKDTSLFNGQFPTSHQNSHILS